MGIFKMRNFDYFLMDKKVKNVRPDIELAKSLLKNVEERERTTLKLDPAEFYLIIFENFYDCLRELLDVILALNGYKSYSHEAAIAYLRDFDFPYNKMLDLDRFRIKRNNSKYYGKSPQTDDALEIKKFYLQNKDFLMKIINDKLD